MNTAGSPTDDEETLREALRRDARRARQLPPFDPALHAATMRRVRALANAPHGPSAQPRPALVVRLTAWFNQEAPWRGSGGWLATAGAGALVLIAFVCLGVRPSFESAASGPTRPGAERPQAVPVGLTGVEGKIPVRTGDRSKGRLASAPPDQRHDARFNPGGFSATEGGVRLLVADLGGTSTARFDLEVPNGPIRLDCGYTPSEDGGLGVLLAKPTLGGSRPF